MAWLMGPLVQQTKSPLGWLSWLFAAFSAAYILWVVPAPGGVVFAVLLPLIVLRFPVVGLVLLAVIAQEVSPNGHRGFLNTLGSGAYIGYGKLPIVLPLAAAAALAAISRSGLLTRLRRMGAGGLALFGSAAGLILLTFVVGVLNDQSMFSAVNQNARPFIIMLLGLAVGASLRRLPHEAGLLTKGVALALIGLLVAAFIAVPFGDSADDRVSRYFIYYDWALPSIAAAVLTAVLVDPKWRWDWRFLSLAASMPLLVLVSFRRSVWIAAFLVFLVAFVLSWRRFEAVLARSAFALIAAAVVVVSAPGFAADLSERSGFGPGRSAWVAGAAPSPTRSVAAQPSTPSTPSSPRASQSPRPRPTPSPKPVTVNDAEHQQRSTEGHIEDLRLGWRYVQQNFWTGVGPKSPQLPGLAATDTARVYVHNELLQDWLRYGPIAPLLVTVFFIASCLLALRTLWDPAADTIARASAAFCLLAPVVLMTGAFLSDTSRWPVLLGVAAGILVRHKVNNDPTQAEIGAS